MSIPAPARKFDRHPICPLCSKDAFQQAQRPDHHPHPPRRPHPRRHAPPHRLRIRRNRTETPRRFRKPHRQPRRHRRGDRLRNPQRHPDPRTRTTRSGTGTATCRPHRALRGRHLPQYSLLVTGMDGNLPSIKAATAPADLYAANADTARVPASTFKVLTLFALNHYANLQARLRTRVTRDSAGLYLMAGGDTLLGAGASDPKQIVGRAGLTTLAELTVKALNEGEKPTAALPVYLDGTFFTGPGVNPGWDAADVVSGQITPIHPIALESHTVPGKSTASNPVRPDDAAVAAQKAFVDALNTAGKESGMSFTLAERRTAPAEAVEIAAVESATLLEQAQHMMLESDNALAEVLGRCAAIAAGKEGSGEAAQQTVRQALVDAGVNIENLAQADVCGMSLTDRVTARTLVQVVALLNADEHAEQLMSTFPVAGVSGTLSDRFGAANAVHARTFVQAKTGTLYTVSSLCGVAIRPDGTRLIFAIILNDLGGSDALPAAKERVDAAAATIANRSTAPSASVAPSAVAASASAPASDGASAPASAAASAAVSTAAAAGAAS